MRVCQEKVKEFFDQLAPGWDVGRETYPERIEAILDRAETLREFPCSGAPLDAISRIHSDYRFVTAGNYLAFYRIREETVYIDRVLYARRDCLRILLDRKE